MITLLVHLLIAIILLAILWWAIGLIPLASPFDQIVRIVLVLILILIIVYTFWPALGVRT